MRKLGEEQHRDGDPDASHTRREAAPHRAAVEREQRIQQALAELRFIRRFGGMTRHRVDFLRHHSDAPDLSGDPSISCKTTARRSGGRLCGEATCQGISWSPMRPGRVSPWPRFSTRGLFESRNRPHGSHASVNPYAVRHFAIPPNSRMNPNGPSCKRRRKIAKWGAARRLA